MGLFGRKSPAATPTTQDSLERSVDSIVSCMRRLSLDDRIEISLHGEQAPKWFFLQNVGGDDVVEFSDVNAPLRFVFAIENGEIVMKNEDTHESTIVNQISGPNGEDIFMRSGGFKKPEKTQGRFGKAVASVRTSVSAAAGVVSGSTRTYAAKSVAVAGRTLSDRGEDLQFIASIKNGGAEIGGEEVDKMEVGDALSKFADASEIIERRKNDTASVTVYQFRELRKVEKKLFERVKSLLVAPSVGASQDEIAEIAGLATRMIEVLEQKKAAQDKSYDSEVGYFEQIMADIAKLRSGAESDAKVRLINNFITEDFSRLGFQECIEKIRYGLGFYQEAVALGMQFGIENAFDRAVDRLQIFPLIPTRDWHNVVDGDARQASGVVSSLVQSRNPLVDLLRSMPRTIPARADLEQVSNEVGWTKSGFEHIGLERRERDDFIKVLYPNGIDKAELSQGKRGDCYLLSAIYTLRTKSPALAQQVITKTIRPSAGGFTVRFLGDGVNTGTNVGDIEVSSQDIQDWRSQHADTKADLGDIILERAYYSYRSRVKNHVRGMTLRFEDPLGRLAGDGGFGHRAFMDLLGGDLCNKHAIGDYQKTGQVPFSDPRRGLTRKGALDFFRDRFSVSDGRYLVTVNSLAATGDIALPSGLVIKHNHAYVVDSYDSTADNISLVNPHDTSKPITLSYDEFAQAFSEVSYVRVASLGATELGRYISELITSGVTPQGMFNRMLWSKIEDEDIYELCGVANGDDGSLDWVIGYIKHSTQNSGFDLNIIDRTLGRRIPAVPEFGARPAATTVV